MHSLKTERYTAPATQTRVAQFNNDGSIAPFVTVSNLGTANGVAIVFQEDDGSGNWTDITGTTKSINPGQSVALSVVTTQRLIALAAQGNEPILVSVNRTINGPVTDLGPA